MIEGGPYGTTCARVGCMPSKLLIAAAEAVHQIERAPGFGVHPTGKTRIDGREVMARVKRERDRFVGFVLEGVDGSRPATKFRAMPGLSTTTRCKSMSIRASWRSAS